MRFCFNSAGFGVLGSWVLGLGSWAEGFGLRVFDFGF